jgi:hypothetical protein
MSSKDLRVLIHQRTAEEEDERERARRGEQEDADERSERAQNADAKQAAIHRKNLKRWDEFKISGATAFDLVEPKPSPVGPLFISFLSLVN